MDERQIRAILALMNIGAPKGSEWCASNYQNSDYITDQYLIRDHWRFYLVEDASVLHEETVDGMVWA